ncbi:MAG: L-fucose/L-arabinose isomerase family protein [Candidatus Omnitrophica bacterium]|nr:L-fucose/L-arabinose isomerase family protein [Candidatus Omnitrophota bacterium]
MKIGVITFTDGRKRVAKATREDCLYFQNRLESWLKKQKHQVVSSKTIVWNWETAAKVSSQVNNGNVDAVIFNFCVWSYPDLTAQVADRMDCPILFLGNINPSKPGWVAFFASAGALDEIGIPFGRILGDIGDKKVQDEVKGWLNQHNPDSRAKGEIAAAELQGMRYGDFDGPSMGMYTGHVDQSQWMSQFGVHVYHRGQLHLWQMAQKIKTDRVEAGLKWLERYCKDIKYNDTNLTPGVDGTLARQVRMYLAMKDFCKEEGIDFCGLTGQLDMTEWSDLCIADVQEALLNDTADWEDKEKKPIICATECDSNGALTMQMLHLLSGTPVLFADLRHYHENLKIYDLVNSGQHAPWFSKRSKSFRTNWKEVTLYPAESFYFRGGGASVHFYAAPAKEVTYARLTRKLGQFRMHMFTGSWVDYSFKKNEELGAMTNYTWPHVWAKFDISPETLAANFSSNHIHAVIGNYIPELKASCEALGIEPIVLS